MKTNYIMTALLLCVAVVAVVLTATATPVVVPQQNADAVHGSLELPETVELRLLVLDEDKNPLADTEIRWFPPRPPSQHQVQMGMMLGPTFLWKTDQEGRITESIERTLALRTAQFSFSNFEQGLQSGQLRWNIPEGWTPDKPIELTVTMFQPRRITGTVIDQEGKPVADAIVAYRIGREPSLFRETQYGTTNADGQFELVTTAVIPLMIHAFHPALGATVAYPDFSPDDPWRFGDDVPEDWLNAKRNNGPFTLTLVRGEAVTVKVVDPEGNPIEGVPVYPTLFETEKDSWNGIGLAIYREEFRRMTDESGIVEYHWLPTPDHQSITFNARGADPRFHVDKDSPAHLFSWGTAVWEAEKENNDLVIQLARKFLVEGSVRYADGSIPQPMQLHASGTLQGEHGPGADLETDAQGNFTYLAHPNERVHVLLNHRSLLREENPIAAVPGIFRDVDVGDGTSPAPRFDFVLQPAMKVFIRMPWGWGSFSIHKVNCPEDEVTDQNGWFGPSRGERDLYNERWEYWLLPGFYRFKIGDKISDLLEVRECGKEWEIDYSVDPPTVLPSGTAADREPAAVPPQSADIVPRSLTPGVSITTVNPFDVNTYPAIQIALLEGEIKENNGMLHPGFCDCGSMRCRYILIPRFLSCSTFWREQSSQRNIGFLSSVRS